MGWRGNYHKESPYGVVEKDEGCCDQHAESYEPVELGYISILLLSEYLTLSHHFGLMAAVS